MTEKLQTQCCIAGGGPAGMMLGLLLARAGAGVLVLEKHADFLRDFRGDTVHPSTLELMHELGMLDEFLTRPHQKVTQLAGIISGVKVTIADFSHLKLSCPYIALMPQWDFLDFLAGKAKAYPGFHLRMQAEVTDLIEESGRITGVIARTPQGPLEVRSDLVVGADGRHSTVRMRANLKVVDSGAPIDVLWTRLPRKDSDPDDTFGNFDAGKIFVMINRREYWQCAYVIPKGSAGEMQRKDVQTLRDNIAQIVPFLADRTQEIRSWDDVKLLTVSVDHLARWWREGLLCIGDAAHAMSPVGGVGINLAVQDAVAAANILAAPLREKRVSAKDLSAVQKRREWPMRMIQHMQIFVHTRIMKRVLKSRESLRPPLPVRLLGKWPWLRRIPAYVVGVGFRPEHIRR